MTSVEADAINNSSVGWHNVTIYSYLVDMYVCILHTEGHGLAYGAVTFFRLASKIFHFLGKGGEPQKGDRLQPLIVLFVSRLVDWCYPAVVVGVGLHVTVDERKAAASRRVRNNIPLCPEKVRNRENNRSGIRIIFSRRTAVLAFMDRVLHSQRHSSMELILLLFFFYSACCRLSYIVVIAVSCPAHAFLDVEKQLFGLQGCI